MRGSEFICGQIALKAWQDLKDEGINGMLAAAFTIRNRVRAGWYGGDWVEVISNHRQWSARLEPYSDQLPDPRNFAFQCLIQEINGIYDGSRRDDITVMADESISARSIFSQQAPKAVLYYGRLDQISNPWFLENIARRPDLHPRHAQVGMTYFFG
jgi:hypothetical protein